MAINLRLTEAGHVNPAAKRFQGLWIEPLDGSEYRWRCASCSWEIVHRHGDDVPEALDSWLIHKHEDFWEKDYGDGE